jgi:hypothetical protein
LAAGFDHSYGAATVHASRGVRVLAFKKDDSYAYPVFLADTQHGTYNISKPPFSSGWRANFFPSEQGGDRTSITHLGKGLCETYEAAVALCTDHATGSQRNKK